MNPVDLLRTALSDRYTILREIGAGGMATVYLGAARGGRARMAVRHHAGWRGADAAGRNRAARGHAAQSGRACTRRSRTDPAVLVRLRQLCSEGKTVEAVAYIDALPADAVDPWLRWLLEEYLGRGGAAADALRALDDAGELYTLSTFLAYTFFDPTPFPKLSATLRRNGALRTQTLPIPYGCRDRRMP